MALDKSIMRYNQVYLVEVTEFAYRQGDYWVFRAKVLRETNFKPFNDRCAMLAKKAHLDYHLLDVNPILAGAAKVGDTVLLYL